MPKGDLRNFKAIDAEYVRQRKQDAKIRANNDGVITEQQIRNNALVRNRGQQYVNMKRAVAKGKPDNPWANRFKKGK